jgi:hypothetical protein
MTVKAFEFPADGGAMAIEPPPHLGVAESGHLLVKDAEAFLLDKMIVGHRWPGLSKVES